MKPFKLTSDFHPAGDQPEAIRALADGLYSEKRHQTLLGVTGSGKTYSVANVIEKIQRPAIVVTHNKTLAAQLYSEFQNFFKHNAVEYFISYYDYYLPEAYIPQTDTYIAKDSSINDDIEKLRLAATSSLMERRDVIIVASVSCIYGLGSPEDFARMSIFSQVGDELNHEDFLGGLIKLLYDRNDFSCQRGSFRVSGDTIDVFLAYRDDFIRFEFWGETVERITCRDPLTAKVKYSLESVRIFPAKHFMLPEDRFKEAKKNIIAEMKEQVELFEEQKKYVEAQRIFQRTTYDLEMMSELGYCSGIENYSRHLSNREPGSRPYTLLDYFPDDFVTIIDESHVTIPQLQGMYNADQSRKSVLVEHGFRLPSALDNRPLNFDEFNNVTGQIVFVTATPGKHEIACSTPIEQVVRPTGLLDPEVFIRPLENQIDDLINEIRQVAAKNERVLVTTLTKRMSEDLADYLRDIDIRVKYMHSEINALERVEILRDLRQGKIDCLVGINLLREGLDLPEVSLVAILDADKEGFLRSETSLIQTAGRASRNANGRVILYADQKTKSINRMVEITTQRRLRQQRYNERNNIIPKTVERAIQKSLYSSEKVTEESSPMIFETGDEIDINEIILSMEKEMLEAAEALEFERAALLRDQITKSKHENEPPAKTSGNNKKKKAIVLLSGGLDSTTALAIAHNEGFQIYAMSFDYGQKHSIELDSAKKIAAEYKVADHRIVSIDLTLFGQSALTANIEVPKRKSVPEIQKEIPVTYVPARNTIFLSYAVAYAEVNEALYIFIGVNAVDYSGYPDCRPEYIAAYQQMANLATKAGVNGRRLTIQTPLINLSKSDIISHGLNLGVNYGLTHSCYDPLAGGKPCQQCDSCLLRAKGFLDVGVRDPLI